jgi:hypothetical protein
MNDQNIIRLKVTSTSMSPDEITGAIGLSPDKTWRIGDLRSVTQITEKCNGWILGSDSARAEGVATQMDRIISRVGENVQNIKQIAATEEVQVSIVIYAKSAQLGINLSKRHIAFIASLGATLDLDLYFTPEDEL